MDRKEKYGNIQPKQATQNQRENPPLLGMYSKFRRGDCLVHWTTRNKNKPHSSSFSTLVEDYQIHINASSANMEIRVIPSVSVMYIKCPSPNCSP